MQTNLRKVGGSVMLAVSPAFLEELSKSSDPIEFLFLNSYITFPDSYWESLGDNKTIIKKLRTLDHISIFYLIAGSYAPVCLITLYNHSGIEIFIIVLTIMLIGTFFKLFYTGKYENFSLFLYLAMGWLIVFKINTLIDLISFNGLALIIASGLFYTLGTFFYSSKKIKYSHAIWHLFVLGGSTTHYLFVLFFII
mgnify:CR=1 FL=1